MKNILFRIKCILFAPLYLLLLIKKEGKRDSIYELRKWEEVLPSIKYKSDFLCFIRMCAAYRDYRSLLLYRLGNVGEFLSYVVPHLSSLYFVTESSKIGNGLILHHAYSTIIFPETMGENCQVWQNVTIGRAHEMGRRPRIGNNVKICAGAVVIGDIEIGDNVTIGANAVVTKSIPSNCVVCGNPAKIVKKDGIRVYESTPSLA